MSVLSRVGPFLPFLAGILAAIIMQEFETPFPVRLLVYAGVGLTLFAAYRWTKARANGEASSSKLS
ncbi:hypothetical protein [Aurantiacibacter flavus]|uniref:EamA domain-containing protein n=1 Tax=Aurantiacibacter flavus TaxID=3145232 RepID=A0ABV0CW31_9SPHN